MIFGLLSIITCSNVYAQDDVNLEDLDLSSLLNTPIVETNQVFIVSDTTINFKPTTARVKDFIDMSMEEMSSISVFVDDDGNPLPILTDEEGNVLGIKDSITIYLPEIDPNSALAAIESKQAFYDTDSVKTANIVKSKPAYFYTASYHNSRVGDTLRVMDIIDLPLEELVLLDVIVGGQSFINLLQSSPNTLIFDNFSLQRGGFNTLGEALSFMSSLNVFDDDHKLSGSVRGSPSGSFNDFMILFNGRSMNSLYSHEAYLSSQFSVQHIEQIEVIYGAGAADFPSDAYAGIINIITKDLANAEGENIILQGGIATPFRTDASISFGASAGKLKFSGNARYMKERISHEDIDQFIKFDERYAGGAPENYIIPQENVNETIYTNNKQAITMDAHMSFVDFYLGTNFYQNEVGQAGLSQLSLDYDDGNEEKHRMLMGYAGFNKLFGENTRLNTEYQFTQENISGNEKNIWVDYDRYLAEFSENSISEDEANTNFINYFGQEGTIGSTRHTGLVRLFSLLPVITDSRFYKGDYSISAGYEANFNDVLGMQMSNSLPFTDFNLERSDDNYMRLPQYRYLTQDAFALVRKSFINERLFLGLGGRYSWHQYFDGEFLIRSEASLKLAPKTYIKAGYNQGVLRPAVSQLLRYDSEGNWLFNSELKSAKSSIANVGFTHGVKEFLSLKSNFFYATFEDHMYPTAFGWENTDETLTSLGVEVKTNIRINELVFSTDYTFQKQLETDLNYYPHNFVLMTNYNAHKYVGINIAYSLASRLKTLNKYTNEEITLPIQSNVNFTVSSREVPLGNSGSFEVICSFKNLFNTELLFPNVNNYGSSVILGRGRSISGRIIVKF